MIINIMNENSAQAGTAALGCSACTLRHQESPVLRQGSCHWLVLNGGSPPLHTPLDC